MYTLETATKTSQTAQFIKNKKKSEKHKNVNLPKIHFLFIYLFI